MSTYIGTPSHVDHATLGGRIARGMVAMVTVLCLAVVGVGGSGWLHRAEELQQFRTALQDLTTTMRAIHPRATAKRRPMVLRIDAARGVFQVTSLQNGRRAYETVEQTIWLPEGLQVVEAPPSLTVLPTGPLSAATIVVVAPSYNRLFRLTTTTEGLVRLDEEPTI